MDEIRGKYDFAEDANVARIADNTYKIAVDAGGEVEPREKYQFNIASNLAKIADNTYAAAQGGGGGGGDDRWKESKLRAFIERLAGVDGKGFSFTFERGDGTETVTGIMPLKTLNGVGLVGEGEINISGGGYDPTIINGALSFSTDAMLLHSEENSGEGDTKKRLVSFGINVSKDVGNSIKAGTDGGIFVPAASGDDGWKKSQMVANEFSNGVQFSIMLNRGDGTNTVTAPINLKTINNEGLVGEGNIEISGSGDESWKGSSLTSRISADMTNFSLRFDRGDGSVTQSGAVNIKTINGVPVIGSGDIKVGSGSGDMTKAVYDPNNKNADAFSMENMSEGANNKILTFAEREKLNKIPANPINSATNSNYTMITDISYNGQGSGGVRFTYGSGSVWELPKLVLKSDGVSGRGINLNNIYVTSDEKYVTFWTDSLKHYEIPIGGADASTYSSLKLNDDKVSANYPQENPVFTVIYDEKNEFMKVTLGDKYNGNHVTFSKKGSPNEIAIHEWVAENQINDTNTVDNALAGTLYEYELFVIENGKKYSIFFFIGGPNGQKYNFYVKE